MLKNLFQRKAETVTPREIMNEVTSRLEDWGYSYDHDANNLIKNAMVASLPHKEECLCEGDVRPGKVIFRQEPRYRYIAYKVALEIANPATGVTPTDKIRFLEENYYSEFSRDKDEPFPSVSVLKEMTVAEVLAQPQSKPITSRIERLTRQAREFFAV